MNQQSAELLAAMINAFLAGAWAEKPRTGSTGWYIRIWVQGHSQSYRLSEETAQAYLTDLQTAMSKAQRVALQRLQDAGLLKPADVQLPTAAPTIQSV